MDIRDLGKNGLLYFFMFQFLFYHFGFFFNTFRLSVEIFEFGLYLLEHSRGVINGLSRRATGSNLQICHKTQCEGQCFIFPSFGK